MTEDSKFQILHTMVRVRDLEKSIDFYTRLLGMTLLRKREVPEAIYTNVFVGYGPEDTNAVLELTYNWDQKTPYELGSGFGHLAIGVSDIEAMCRDLAEAGVKVPRPPGPMKHGGTVIAFIEDPDGYRIELIERA